MRYISSARAGGRAAHEVDRSAGQAERGCVADRDVEKRAAVDERAAAREGGDALGLYRPGELVSRQATEGGRVVAEQVEVVGGAADALVGRADGDPIDP